MQHVCTATVIGCYSAQGASQAVGSFDGKPIKDRWVPFKLDFLGALKPIWHIMVWYGLSVLIYIKLYK